MTDDNLDSKTKRILQTMRSAARKTGEFYSNNKDALDATAVGTAVIVAGGSGVSHLIDVPLYLGAATVGITAAYAATTEWIAKRLSTRGKIATYTGALIASQPLIHAASHMDRDLPLDEFFADLFEKSPEYAAIMLASYAGVKIIDGARRLTEVEGQQDGDPSDASRRDFLKKAARTTAAAGATAYLGHKGISSLSHILTAEHPEDPIPHEDINLGILVGRPREILDGNTMDIDVLARSAETRIGKNLTVRYFMLDETNAVPEDGSNHFYNDLVFMGERSDLAIEQDGRGDISGFFEYNKSLETPFAEGTAFINPFASEKTETGRMKFLVEVWDGDEKIDHKWWGHPNNSELIFNFRRYNEEEPERTTITRPASGDRKVFIYKQQLGSSRGDADALAVADYLHHHMLEFRIRNGRVDVRDLVGSRTKRNIKRQAAANNVKLLPMISAFSSGLVRSVINNPRDSAEAVSRKVRSEGYHGIAIDLESIHVGARDSGALVNFMRELRSRLPQNQYDIAIAVSPRFAGSASRGYRHHGFYDYSAISPHVDFIELMAYDFHKGVGRPTPVLPNDKIDDIANYAKANIPDNNKIVFLLPFYGYAWTTGGAQVGSISSRAAQGYRQRASSQRYDNGESRIEYTNHRGQGRIAYAQDGRVFRDRLALLEQLGISNAGGWRQSHATHDIFQEIANWKGRNRR